MRIYPSRSALLDLQNSTRQIIPRDGEKKLDYGELKLRKEYLENVMALR